MPFEYLSFFHENSSLRREAMKNILSLAGLRDQDRVMIGVNGMFPVIRIGHFLIKYAIPSTLGSTHQGLFIGETRGNAIVIEGKEVFYKVRITDIVPGVDTRHISIMDVRVRSAIARNKINRSIENMAFGGAASLHSCDTGTSPLGGGRNQWYVQPQYILYKIGRDDYDWVIYFEAGPPSKSRRYTERKNKILNNIIGSRVKIIDKSVFSDLKFKNKAGKIVCTIPDISVVTSSRKLLRALIVDFGEDVGGYSMDGKYSKGSCLVVSPEKVRIEGG